MILHNFKSNQRCKKTELFRLIVNEFIITLYKLTNFNYSPQPPIQSYFQAWRVKTFLLITLELQKISILSTSDRLYFVNFSSVIGIIILIHFMFSACLSFFNYRIQLFFLFHLISASNLVHYYRLHYIVFLHRQQ